MFALLRSLLRKPTTGTPGYCRPPHSSIKLDTAKSNVVDFTLSKENLAPTWLAEPYESVVLDDYVGVADD